MIGNDIVDLGDADSRSDSLHPRFDDRVFDAREREMLLAGGDVHRRRWLLWAAKESAYKLLRRTLPDLVFSPRRFAVRAAGPGALTVEAAGHVVCVRHDCEAQFVHCLASYRGAGPTIVQVERLTEGVPEHASLAARRLAVRSIARSLSIDADELAVERVGRMPVLLRRGRPLPGTLSLSHHGRFVAFAWREDASRCIRDPRADDGGEPPNLSSSAPRAT